MRTPLYYIQINAFCIIVLYLMMKSLPTVTVEKQDLKVYRFLIRCCIIFCGSDIVTWLVNEQVFTGAVALNYISNMVYYLASAFISLMWLIYVLLKSGAVPKGMNTRRIRLSIPMIIFAVLVVTTPLTGWIFNVSPENVYHRGGLVFVHWLVSWGYVLAAGVITTKHARLSDSRTRKAEMVPLRLFMIPPVAASIIQIFLEGSSFITMGFTLAMIIIFVRMQNNQISIDVLTGVNNRGHLDRYLEDKMQTLRADDEIFMVMMDVNKFKSINDTYGHIIGDKVLVSVATALKELCGQVQRGLFLARYGGDEFVIVSCGQQVCDPEQIIAIINEAVFNMNRTSSFPFEVTISAGYTKGMVADYSSADHLIKKADEAMYEVKKKSNNIR